VLEGFLSANPNDAFARYGLAMECANSGDAETAIQHYAKLVELHPDYVPCYYQYGQLLIRLARKEEARRVFGDGIRMAQKAGNSHAASEMEEALRLLDS
jgi:tetratricopeptide (TPR) repeat protein